MAPLWVAYQANLGTLLRTCDAVGACMAVPRTPHYRAALARGNTLPERSCVHWEDGLAAAGTPPRWPDRRRGVRRAGPTSAPRVPATCQHTVVLLGHERGGIPAEATELADEIITIPMIGRGVSLNVAVAGSLVLYRLAGLM